MDEQETFTLDFPPRYSAEKFQELEDLARELDMFEETLASIIAAMLKPKKVNGLKQRQRRAAQRQHNRGQRLITEKRVKRRKERKARAIAAEKRLRVRRKLNRIQKKLRSK